MSIIINGMDMPKGNSTKNLLIYSDGRVFTGHKDDVNYSAEELKTGKWIDEGFYADGHGAHVFRCSECGGHIIENDTDPFCKWCGTDMRQRGEQDE